MQDQAPDLKAENEALKLENATKSDLISVSAHGLRTSLTAMKWILKMLIDGDLGALTPEQLSLVNKAYESDDRMIRLVTEMLSINHAEDTIDAMKTTPTDLVKLLDEVVFDFAGESYKKGIELIYLKPPQALAPAVVDAEKMRVVFQNLIENAIKYSNKGGKVFVNIGERDGSAEISVRDTGIGINDADKPKMFGKLFRADNAKAQDSVGSGLGLYTTQRIIERHKGKIWFESRPGEGTTFFVSVPEASPAV